MPDEAKANSLTREQWHTYFLRCGIDLDHDDGETVDRWAQRKPDDICKALVIARRNRKGAPIPRDLFDAALLQIAGTPMPAMRPATIEPHTEMRDNIAAAIAELAPNLGKLPPKVATLPESDPDQRERERQERAAAAASLLERKPIATPSRRNVVVTYDATLKAYCCACPYCGAPAPAASFRVGRYEPGRWDCCARQRHGQVMRDRITQSIALEVAPQYQPKERTP